MSNQKNMQSHSLLEKEKMNEVDELEKIINHVKSKLLVIMDKLEKIGPTRESLKIVVSLHKEIRQLEKLVGNVKI